MISNFGRLETTFLDVFLSFLLKFKIPLALGILGTFFIVLGVISPSLNQSGKKQIVVEKSNNSQTVPKVKVDVSGAVLSPGVYALENGSRIVDAVKAAGGFADKVDSNWVSKNLNLAAKLTDGQKVFVAAVGESPTSSVLSENTQTSMININTASSAQLDTLPGVGSVTAGKIIAARPFQKVEELLERKIVNNSTFSKIKDLISVY